MPPDARPLSPSGAAGVWGTAQLAAVLSSAVGVRLWPHHPDPPESIALPVLVAVQMVTASFLYPVLFSGFWTATVNLGLAICFDQIAGLLAFTPQTAVLRSVLLVSLWAGGLACCGRLARGPAAETTVTVLAVLWTVGGVLMFYTRSEAAAVGGSPAPDACCYGPLLAAIAQSAGTAAPLNSWMLTAVPLLAAAAEAVRRYILLRPRVPAGTPSTSLHDPGR